MDCYDRIKELCDKNGIAVTALETQLGFGRGSIGKMRTAKSVSADRVKKIAEYFGVSAEYLLTGESPTGYYYNEDAMEIAQEIYQNKDLHMLFDMTRNASADELRDFAKMIELMQKRERHED